MCERTYVGCSNCGGPVDEMSYWASQSFTEYAHLDEDGDPIDYYNQSEPETHDSGYECHRCESDHVSLDTECEPDECDCRECDPETAILEPEDDSTVVLLRRRLHGHRPPIDEDAPPEILQLFSDRAITVVPIRAERAVEIYDEIPHDYANVDVESIVPMHLQEAA